MPNETLLFTVWKFKIFNPYPLKTLTNKEVEIVCPGDLNTNSGPDFLNARVKIESIQWAGNIEIHQKTSDFLKHEHHKDKNYHSLILHVVYEHDTDIELPYPIEIIELKNFIAPSTIQQYQSLVNNVQTPACLNLWPTIDELILHNWFNRVLVERLEKKYDQLKAWFEKTKDYQECFYRLFCRHLGFKVNNDVFEKLAEKLPLKLLLKHSNDLELLEALIYGTAGFLDEAYTDHYLTQLQNEFEFLRKKYAIEPIDKHLWKFARMRASNFPSLRMHQLALMLHQVPEMFHDPARFFLNPQNMNKLHIQPKNYFSNHLTFNEDKYVNKSYQFGNTAIQLMLINVIVPYLFFYGKSIGEERYQTLSLDYLEKIPAEDNAIIRKFAHQKQYIKSALHSQALLELYPNYCEQKRCMDCSIGINLLKK